MYVLALAAYLTLSLRPRPKLLLQTLLLVGGLAIFFVSISSSGPLSIATLSRNDEALSSPEAEKRLRDYEAIIGGDFTSVFEDARVGKGEEFIGIVEQSPLLGHGTAFSLKFPQGPHNLYLRQWTDNGVLGLILLLVFLFASFLHFARYKDVRGMIFVVVFSFMGIFTHNLFSDHPIMVMLGFLGALVCVEAEGQRANPRGADRSDETGPRGD
jgi:hypothetical protein